MMLSLRVPFRGLVMQSVINMIIQGRSPTVRHVSCTHRVALDWLFDRTNLDTMSQVTYDDRDNQLVGEFEHSCSEHRETFCVLVMGRDNVVFLPMCVVTAPRIRVEGDLLRCQAEV